MTECSVEREYYDNGVLKSERPHIAGQTHGAYKQWWKNGKLKSLCEHKNGWRDGEYKRWDRKGNLRLSETFVDDVRHGVSVSINESGVVRKIYLDRDMYIYFNENHVDMMADFLRDHGYDVQHKKTAKFENF